MKFEYIDKEPEIGDLVIWENYLGDLVISDKPYLVTDKSNKGLVKILDERNKLTYMGNVGRKVLKQINPDNAKAGDYMFRLTKGQKEFPEGSIIKVNEVGGRYLYYKSTCGVFKKSVVVIRPQQKTDMKITDYSVDISGTSVEERLVLRQVLIDNKQNFSSGLRDEETIKFFLDLNVLIFDKSNKLWCGGYKSKTATIISYNDFVDKFRKEKTIECKYPLFMQWKDEKTFIVKFEDLGSGVVMTKSEGWNIGDFYDMFIHHTNNQWEPCDFTKEPEIFDLDWYEARYQAGLPVYVVSKNTYQLCKHVPPKGWSSYETFAIEIPKEDLNLDNPKTLKDWDKRFEAGLPVWHQLNYKTYCMCQKSPCNYTEGTEFYTANPSCQDNVEANQQTKKENPMKLQELINQIFKSDYENKPNFLVTVYEKEGSEFASTTANSLEEIEKAVAADYRLVGYKIVAYKIHTEFESAIPVTKTKLKIEKETL